MTSTGMSSIVPRPRAFDRKEGAVALASTVPIVPSDGRAARNGATRLAFLLDREVGVALDVDADATDASPRIVVAIEPGDDPEAYRIDVADDRITLAAPAAAGLEYAAQTLVGLLESRDGAWVIPRCSVRDAPEHDWRGFMIDPARGFIPVDRVKRLIDGAARAKLNRLHLHLLDAESSAMEFETYPALTDPLPERFHDIEWVRPSDQDDTPGYTAEDIDELVEYAGARNIELVPELDFPGHAVQALAAYPELRCSVPDGEPSYWTICAGSEETYEFIDGLVSELAERFPFEVIHMGGDEFEFDYSWEDCEHCRERMDAEGLDDTDELFEYFLRRVHGILDDYDRRLMLWNDGLDISRSPDIPRDTLIQFWSIMEPPEDADGPIDEQRGAAPGHSMARFLEEGFEVVNSYRDGVYIDRRTDEPTMLSWAPTTRPRAPDGYEEQVIGGEMPAWSGWRDESWREYYRRSLPSAIPVFGDRVWNASSLEDRESFERGVLRHALGPAIPDNFDLYENLGGIILPVDHSRNELKAHANESLAGRTIDEAVERYEANIEALEELLAADAVPFPDAAEAYVDCLEWLLAVADYEERGVIGYP